MRARTAAGDTLFGKTRGSLLALLYGRPDQAFYYREIGRLLPGISPGSLQRELGTLSRAGLIDRSKVGNQVFYQAARHHPVFPELRSLVNKTTGSFALLQASLAPLAEEIGIAFVFGSTVTGTDHAESDLDLMVVGDVTLDQVVKVLAGPEKDLGRAINPTVYSAAELQTKLANKNHFLHAVMKSPKIFLIGDEGELRKMGRVRLAAR